ncbi:hypothetical protein Q1695_008733 [Nippostrongylus brasiliensis]|nr:hypothetical protein Q1695_008733 [Nippostrongylus brasiliensis]
MSLEKKAVLTDFTTFNSNMKTKPVFSPRNFRINWSRKKEKEEEGKDRDKAQEAKGSLRITELPLAYRRHIVLRFHYSCSNLALGIVHCLFDMRNLERLRLHGYHRLGEKVISCVALVLIRESVCDAAEIGVAAATTAVSALGSLVFVLFYSISCSWMFTDTQWFIVELLYCSTMIVPLFSSAIFLLCLCTPFWEQLNPLRQEFPALAGVGMPSRLFGASYI